MWWIIILLLCVSVVTYFFTTRRSFYAPPRDTTTILPFIDPSSNTVDTTTQSNVYQDMGGFLSTRENPMSQYFQGGDLFQEVQMTGDSCIDPILEPFANMTSNTLIYGYSSQCSYPFSNPSSAAAAPLTFSQTDVFNDAAAWPNKFEAPLSNVASQGYMFSGLESSAGNAPMTVIPSDEQYAYAHPITEATQYTNPTYISTLTSFDIPFIGATQ